MVPRGEVTDPLTVAANAAESTGFADMTVSCPEHGMSDRGKAALPPDAKADRKSPAFPITESD